MVQKDF